MWIMENTMETTRILWLYNFFSDPIVRTEQTFSFYDSAVYISVLYS